MYHTKISLFKLLNELLIIFCRCIFNVNHSVHYKFNNFHLRYSFSLPFSLFLSFSLKSSSWWAPACIDNRYQNQCLCVSPNETDRKTQQPARSTVFIFALLSGKPPPVVAHHPSISSRLVTQLWIEQRSPRVALAFYMTLERIQGRWNRSAKVNLGEEKEIWGALPANQTVMGFWVIQLARGSCDIRE